MNDTRKQIIEEWKDIPNYIGLYQASDLGIIKSLWNSKSNNSKERILKLWNRRWYKKIWLYKSWVYKEYSVHRLIMITFNGYSELQVNHINWIKDDNRLENLEYLSASDNMKHAYDTNIKKVPTNNNFIMKKWNGRNKKTS